MLEHGPKCLAGPIRGTSGWWQELGKLDETTHAGSTHNGTTAVAPPAKRKRARKRSETSRDKAPAVRTELVKRVREEIAAGTYDTPARWEAALDRLLDHLSSS